MKEEKVFTVLELSRKDFRCRGYDASEVSDEDMEAIAARIGHTLLDGGDFWLSIDLEAEDMGLNKIEDDESD